MNKKQKAQVTYLGCVLDGSVAGKPMPLKVINKRETKIPLYEKNKFLRPEFRRMLCNALIQPYFD